MVKLRRTASTCIVSTLKTKENKNWSSRKWPQNLKPSTLNSSLPRPASSALPEPMLAPGALDKSQQMDAGLAGGSCAGSFLEDSPQLRVQCKSASLLEITPQSGPRLCGTNRSCAYRDGNEQSKLRELCTQQTTDRNRRKLEGKGGPRGTSVYMRGSTVPCA